MITIIIGHAGAGKTTLLKYLKTKNYETIVADEIVDFLYKKGNIGYQAIANTFGSKYINLEKVKKDKLRELVSQDKKAYEKLNQTILPLILVEISKKIKSLQENKTMIFVEAPVFFLYKNNIKFDFVLEVSCKEEIAIKRLQEVKGLSQDQAKKMLDFYQAPAKPNFVLNTNDGLNSQEVDSIIEKLKKQMN